ncbi:MAG TPA: hypothetical protein PKM84_03040 [Candidatus Pacearchaeota archaeon]|nr:hypothetical protein [Candidatus Pacearchaeota archaeon]
MSIFEITMLICFGLSWPFAIIKSYKAKTSVGKSPFFTILLAAGYLAGITHKLLYSRDFVIIFYGINLSMVLLELYLYFRNKNFDRLAQQKNAP